MAALPNKRIWWILTVLAIIVGTGWRAAHLENRPLHADEAVQAWQTWQLLDGEGYRYDPLDRHGPTLYFGAAWLHQLQGGTADDFDDRSARRYALAAGIATLILLGFGARPAGFPTGTGALAATLLAFETLTSLYHTYFVQEASLAFLIWAFVFLALSGDGGFPLRKVFLLGIIVGLAQATKATAPLYLGVSVIALAFTHPSLRTAWSTKKTVWASLGALIPFVLFYSSFGSHPMGVIDGFRTYLLQADRLEASPHLYPWWYHLRTLGIVPSGGPNWGQYLLLALGLIGGALACRKEATRAHRVTALVTLSLLLIHSAIPYKTPWLLVTPMIGIVLLAASVLAWCAQGSRLGIVGTILLVGLTGAQSLAKSQLALDRYPGDERNPYFYVQAPRGLLKLPERIDQLQAATTTTLRVAVVSPEHAWPLPWYFRHHSDVGYFDSLPSSLYAWDVIVWDSQLGDPPIEQTDFPIAEIYGLRPNGLLFVFINQPTWERVFPPLAKDDS